MTKNKYTSIATLRESAKQRRYKDVSIPGIGTFRIQSLTEGERSRIETSYQDAPGKLYAALIAAAQVDGDGLRVWTDGSVDEVLELDSRFTSTMASAITNHIGIGSDEVEELAKNLDSLDGDLPTD